MKIDRSKFFKLLDNLRAGLGRKGDVETSFHFVDGRVVTYSRELSISVQLTDGDDIQGAVLAKKLFEAIAKSEPGQIEIGTRQEKFYIAAGTMKAGINLGQSTLPAEVLQQPAVDAWKNLPGDFGEKLKLCLISLGRNSNDPELQCVHWLGDMIESCDNMRMTRCKTASIPHEDVDFLIPGRLAVTLVKHKLTSFAITGDWLYFKALDGTQISCRIYAGRFPDLNGVISLQFEPAFRFPSSSKEILQLAQTLASTDPVRQPFVKIRFEGGVMSAIDMSENEPIKSDFVNCREDLGFVVNPKFLLKILGMGYDNVNLSVKREGDGIRFLRFDGEGFTHIVGVAVEATKPEEGNGDTEESTTPENVQSARQALPVTTILYCAGTLGAEFNHDLLKREIKNRLLSFPYMKGNLIPGYFVDYRENCDSRMVDSGAFSVWNKGEKVDFDKYVAFCKGHIGYIEHVVNLDVIPGTPGEKNLRLMGEEVERSAAEGRHNYDMMVQDGIPKEKIIHVFHQGEDFKWLKSMVGEMDYIGLSPGNDRTREEKISWLIECMKYVTDAEGRPIVKFHGFAVTSLKIVKLFPWASVDSATWGIAAGLGRIMIPRKKKNTWDFASDTPMVFSCSQILDKLEHVDHQGKLFLKTVLYPYFESLGLKKGESTYAKRIRETYQLQENERWMNDGVGDRVGITCEHHDFSNTFAKGQFSQELKDGEAWVETVVEPGVINSREIRQYLNVHYFNMFLKSLPRDRRFVTPVNTVDIRDFLARTEEEALNALYVDQTIE